MNYHDFDIDTFRMWRPPLQQAIIAAIKQKQMVTITTHWPLDELNTADLTLNGRFVGLTQQLAQYIVDEFDPELGKTAPAAPECEYVFAADLSLGSGLSRFEYGGRAIIVDQELQKNNIPESLLLRLGLPLSIRRIRRHRRERGASDIFLMPGLMLMEEEPGNRRRLLALLGHYYKQKTRPKPVLVDISAGGASLKTDDHSCQRFLGADCSYLFFFFTEENGVLKSPHVFMAKKAGILRDKDSSHAGLRLRFLKELVWTGPNEDLKWINIEADGSATIKRILDVTEKRYA